MANRGPAEESEERLSAYFSAYSSRSGSTFAFVVTHMAETFAAFGAMSRIPVIESAPTDSVEGRAVRTALTPPRVDRLLLRGTRAVLTLPERGEDYTEGSSRGTVRRKVRAAERAGITWRSVTDESEKRRLIALADAHERANEREQYRNTAPENGDLTDFALWLVAVAADGTPLVLAVIPVDSGWATLRYFRTLVAGDDSSVARYYLMPVLAAALAERGVRYLADTATPQWLPGGLRHFQRMVGFRLVRVRLTPARQTRVAAGARTDRATRRPAAKRVDELPYGRV